MKKRHLFLTITLLLAGCSTGSNIVFETTPQPERNLPVSAPVIAKSVPVPLEQSRPWSEPPASAASVVAPPVEKKEPVVVVNQQKPVDEQKPADEEDNIAKLLAPDDFQKFDIPIVFNDTVKYYIGWFTTEKRKVFANWLRRSRRYIPIIKEILKEHGMPEDLVYLSMIESGFNPKAYSTAKACGPWQFIYETGGRYGLKVNIWVDERRDPQKSTVAAAKYLKDLFNQFGCWYLAAAGYNAGEKRIERAIEKHNTNDFWELARYNALPRETREYIPKLIAAAIIAKDPEKFGFGNIEYEPVINFESVKVPGGIPLTIIAKRASVDLDDLRAVNPEIIGGITPPNVDNYLIKLPSLSKDDGLEHRLELALAKERKLKNITPYKVRAGDTFAKILKRHRLKKEDFALVNECNEDFKVRPGIMVLIPWFSSPERKTMLASAGEGKEMPAKKTAKRTRLAKRGKQDSGEDKEGVEGQNKQQLQVASYHVVKKGETLSAISGKYGIDVADLKSGNKLKGDRVYPNMKLKLVSHIEKKRGPSVKYHVVKKGETLSAISGKYGIDVTELKLANKLKSDRVIPRMKLKIIIAER